MCSPASVDTDNILQLRYVRLLIVNSYRMEVRQNETKVG